MAQLYWYGGSGDWNSGTSHWSTNSGNSPSATHATPTSADSVRFDANSFSAGSSTVNIPSGVTASCLDMDWTGATNSPTLTDAGDGLEPMNIYGSITLISTFTDNTTYGWSMLATSGTKTITSNGGVFAAGLSIGGGGAGATFNLADDITGLSSVSNGTFNTNNHNILASILSFSGGTINLGTSTITCNYAGSSSFANSRKFYITGGTISASSASIIMTSTGTNTSTFTGNGNSFGSLTIQGSGVNGVIIAGSNTIGTLTVDRSQAAKTLKITNSTTTTVTNFVCATSGTTVVTITNTSSTTPGTLTKSGGGTIGLDYLSITNSTATPSSTWYAGTHSTNGGNNSGWTFTAPPATATGNFFNFL